MDDVVLAAVRGCKFVVAVLMTVALICTVGLWVTGRPYQQATLVVVTFTLPMVAIILVVDGLLMLAVRRRDDLVGGVEDESGSVSPLRRYRPDARR